jgi:hypothetical protein
MTVCDAALYLKRSSVVGIVVVSSVDETQREMPGRLRGVCWTALVVAS